VLIRSDRRSIISGGHLAQERTQPGEVLDCDGGVALRGGFRRRDDLDRRWVGR
jgi:hypothetical protein